MSLQGQTVPLALISVPASNCTLGVPQTRLSSLWAATQALPEPSFLFGLICSKQPPSALSPFSCLFLLLDINESEVSPGSTCSLSPWVGPLSLKFKGLPQNTLTVTSPELPVPVGTA